MIYETNVIMGSKLSKMVEQVKHLGRKTACEQVKKFIYGKDYTRVCAVYGLQSTGKRTVMLQAIADMSEEDFSKTAYIEAKDTDCIQDVADDLQLLCDKDVEYVFINEITRMRDFIDGAALLSDIFAMMGMKIVLTGTSSLSFWLSRDHELYDRVRLVHTTYMPYQEYSRLMGNGSMQEYLRNGGFTKELPFADRETLNQYIDTAVGENMQFALEHSERGREMFKLRELYNAGELVRAIRHVVEEYVRNNVKHALSNVLDVEVIEKGIDQSEEFDVKITEIHRSRIENYLKGLDVIVKCPVEKGDLEREKEDRYIFTQPGMSYLMSKVYVESLLESKTFANLQEDEKECLKEQLLKTIQEHLLKDMVLLETSKTLGRPYEVFKTQFKNGVYDMLICDHDYYQSAIYEIHNSKCHTQEQGKHLTDDYKLALTTPRHGKLVGRYVLYLGENMDSENGIAYRNAEEFLKNLPNISLNSGLENVVSENENQGMMQSM